MLFNSYAFLLFYLPVVLAGFAVAARFGKRAGASWLAVCSLAFYAWWDFRYLALLLVSIGVNYGLGVQICQHVGKPRARLILATGVVLDLGLLAYYKYADFFIASVDAALGQHWPLLHIVLPIGISFFTFTQIAFLVDAYAGYVAEYRFINYVLFVSYFPHLVAGPVLHHKEMMPQFDDDRNYVLRAENFAVGLSIFAMGLAKKVLIADNLADGANALFATEAAPPTLLMAWGGTLAYTFQLYFDFSGYSDMAIGLSRLFGVKLPLNFASPYKAVNIQVFWRCWHMTLSRFLRDYLYIPLGGNRHGTVRRRINLFTTMVLGGLWHGAGWNFAIWGALHGAYLIAHQVWQMVAASLSLGVPRSLARFVSTGLTFVCVVLAWVFFRAPNLDVANRVFSGLFARNGVALPEALMSRLGALAPWLERAGIHSFLGGGGMFFSTWQWVLGAGCVAFLAPNTQQIMSRFEPALLAPNDPIGGITRWRWQPCRRDAILLGILLAAGMLALSRPTEFLYFQF